MCRLSWNLGASNSWNPQGLSRPVIISPARCTILLNIFISLLYMFRASMCPSSGENYCIYATRVFVTLYGWRLVCWLDFQSIHVSGIHVPIIRRKLLYLCDTGICHSVWVASGLLVGMKTSGICSATDQTPPIQSDKCQYRIDTVISSWWWAHGCPKHVEKRNKYTKQNCATSWTYLEDYIGMYGVNKT